MSSSEEVPATLISNEDPVEVLKTHLPDFPISNIPLIDTITSYLGKHNPFAHPIEPTSTILWLFDNTAYQVSSGPANWQIELIAAYFVRRTGAESSKIVAQLARTIGLAENSEAKKTIAQRLVPLLNDILPAHTAQVELGDDGDVVNIGPSGPNGISHDVLEIPDKDWKDGDVTTSKAASGVEGTPAKTTFAKSEGFAVVSDIDDTIKVTMTNSPLGILKSTFVDEPKPIEGMPEFYSHLSSMLGKPPFWYLSASPYNLYPFLRAFREEFYPAGTMLLRDASWRNLAGFLASLTQGTQAYKFDHLKMMQSYWPGRKVICIGDSTQSDPEAYAAAYRENPAWVKAIWIRKVKDIVEAGDLFPGQGEAKRNNPERFEKAFEGVPKDVWYVFDDPRELYAKLDALVKDN